MHATRPLPHALRADALLALPAGAARHVQVLRLQPGDALTLFDGRGGEYAATVERMGRSEVTVQVGAHDPVEREAPRAVHLAVGMPANERMDWLVEKATELGVASIQPLITAHGVLRLAGERAEKKRAHWQAIAVGGLRAMRPQPGAARPSGRGARRRGWRRWAGGGRHRCWASAPDARPLPTAGYGRRQPARRLTLLSGPEGGLAAGEQDAALASGFALATLGPRVLRAETAALAALMVATAMAG